jgi:xanthine dehydrogenase small subunit
MAPIRFFLNGKPVSVDGDDAFLTLANFLRYLRALTGTKIVCEEGDCGACSVLIGRPAGDSLAYLPINSCIQFLFQVNGTHVVTVEGLRQNGALHPVQEAMVRCHGAQCGYCTPGFIVAMCAMYESPEQPTEKRVRDALTGNLCRCTGYEPIIKAGLSVDPETVRSMNELYPPAPMLAALREQTGSPIRIEGSGRTFFAPTTVEEAVRFRAEFPQAVICQGGTDIAVQHNKRGFTPAALMNLENVPELAELTVKDSTVAVGATVTLTRLEHFFRDRVPEFHRILELFGAPQIKHAATLAGNVANASPIADSLPFLYVMDARVELAGSGGRREVPIEAFYLGYKKLDLRGDELITRILIPLPGDEVLKLYKVSKRRNLDISTFTAAICMTVGRRLPADPGSAETIHAVRIAYGGVAPTVLRLPRTEGFLEGRSFSLDSFRQAGEIARGEIAPISDVRGSKDFRLQLAENVLMKFYYDVQQTDSVRRSA